MKIDPNKIKIRDYALLQIILGATKAGVHVDRKKRDNKKRCRKKVRVDSAD